MQKIGILLASFALMLTLGAGCDETELQETTQSKSADIEVSDSIEVENSDMVLENGDITLSAKAEGKNTVNFEWEVSDTLEEQAEGWRIVYGKDENPSYPSTWWFERSKPHREKTWAGLPSGKAHFRVCAVVDEKCDIYSNNIEIEIPGSPVVEEATMEDEVEDTSDDSSDDSAEVEDDSSADDSVEAETESDDAGDDSDNVGDDSSDDSTDVENESDGNSGDETDTDSSTTTDQ